MAKLDEENEANAAKSSVSKISDKKSFSGAASYYIYLKFSMFRFLIQFLSHFNQTTNYYILKLSISFFVISIKFVVQSLFFLVGIGAVLQAPVTLW